MTTASMSYTMAGAFTGVSRSGLKPDKGQFRLVNESDKDLLFSHQNEPEKLERMGRKRPFTRKEFNARFKNNLGRQFLFEMPEYYGYQVCNIIPIGGVLLTARNGWLGIPWMLFPEFRGKGYGKIMVQEAVDEFPGKKKALIHYTNIPSLRCAQSAGYKIADREGENLVLTWISSTQLEIQTTDGPYISDTDDCYCEEGECECDD